MIRKLSRTPPTMSSTDGPPLSPPRVLSEATDSYHLQYGFQTEEWVVNPVPAGPDWFSSDARMRRDANAYAYRQSGNPIEWNRYVDLGLFTTADCVEFEVSDIRKAHDTIMSSFSPFVQVCHTNLHNLNKNCVDSWNEDLFIPMSYVVSVLSNPNVMFL